MTAENAPAFYRLTWDPLQILVNILGYLDRAGTIFAAALVLLLVVHGRPGRLDSRHKRLLGLAGLWFVAGIAITAYCYNMNDSFTDAEIDRGFKMTRALGTNVMTTSTQMTVARRIAPLAGRARPQRDGLDSDADTGTDRVLCENSADGATRPHDSRI